ncbi:MAG: SGNH/GDSL hydrolase family protein [Pseudomonas sp.]
MTALFRLARQSLTVVLVSLLCFGSAQAINPPASTAVDTLIIGDSVFALSGDIHRNLERDLNKTINTSARSGCQMIGGNFICSRRYSIPTQYANANKRGIKTVIFNGGGNDIQLNSCAPSLSRCMPLLNDLEDEIAKLAQQMRADGVQKIIFLGYYNGTGNAAALHEINNYSMARKAATYAGLGITFIDVRQAFNGNESRYLLSDGIHPTAAGSRVLADLIRRAL